MIDWITIVLMYYGFGISSMSLIFLYDEHMGRFKAHKLRPKDYNTGIAISAALWLLFVWLWLCNKFD